MKVVETGFDGLIIIETQTYRDERGLFYESWRENKYKEIGIQEPFLQDNVSLSHKNVLRGLHYQKNQGQLVTVLQGSIFDVVVDLRPDSKTFRKYFSLELSSDYPRQLYMPSGFAHGFYVVSDMVIINYKCTQYYNAAHESGVIWNDPDLGIKWPCDDPIVSEKDLNFLPCDMR